MPTRARHIEQASALEETSLRIRGGIDENVTVVERGNELHCPRLLHGIAEHVARHVADTDGGERGITDVEVHFAEVALHRFPGAAGGNAHFFMVVTG